MKLTTIFEIQCNLKEDFFLNIFNVVKTHLLQKEKIKKVIESDELSINLMIIDDGNMQKLNKQWRNKNQTTDVLSFPYVKNMEKIDENLDVFWEVFISLPQCKKQAQEYSNTLEKELIKLFIHGVLHLFGYDHIKDADFELMNKEEIVISKAISLK